MNDSSKSNMIRVLAIAALASLAMMLAGVFVRNTALIIIGAIVFFGSLGAVAYFNKQQMAESGKIIKREGQWWKDEVIFSTTATFPEVQAALKTIDISDSGAAIGLSDQGKAVHFKCGEKWDAALADLGPENGRNTFGFFFLSWETKSGVNTRADQMNIVLTAVEKMFLSIDPTTTVETHRGKFKSKISFL